MKNNKFKLKKDFPCSKIGDVWVQLYDGFMMPEGKGNIKMHKSLFKPFDEWFDKYKEPKDEKYWYIDDLGKIEFHSTILDEIVGTPNNAMIRKIIGNYFETREEAEKAVEKLKAWKRLKDTGFRFTGWRYALEGNRENGTIPLEIKTECNMNNSVKDLDLLFGGKDE